MRNTIIRSSSFLKLKMILKRYTLFIFIAFFLLFSSQTLAQLTEDANEEAIVNIKVNDEDDWALRIPYTHPTVIKVSWEAKGVDHCYAFGHWRGKKSHRGVEYFTLRRKGLYLYGLMCIGAPKIKSSPIPKERIKDINTKGIFRFDSTEVILY